MRLLLAVFGVVLLPQLCFSQERLVDAYHVIYRESQDDYLFRIRYSYEPDLWTLTRRDPPSNAIYPDTVFAFEVSDGNNMWGAIRSHSIPEMNMVTVESRHSVVGYAPFSLTENVVEVSVPRETFGFSESDPRGNFVMWTTKANVGSYPQIAITLPVALNVPEPSTLLLATGTILVAVPLVALRRRRNRQQGL